MRSPGFFGLLSRTERDGPRSIPNTDIIEIAADALAAYAQRIIAVGLDPGDAAALAAQAQGLTLFKQAFTAI